MNARLFHRQDDLDRRIARSARSAGPKRILLAALMAGSASVAQAVPVTLTISATLPSGNTPTDFSTSFSIDSNTATTDVYTNAGGIEYGYSAASLKGFGFTIDGVSFTTADIDTRSLVSGHSSDIYLNASIGSGKVSEVSLSLTHYSAQLQIGQQTVLGIQPGILFDTDVGGFVTIDVVTSSVSPGPSTVPEPGSVALLGMGGVLGLTAIRRCRRSLSSPLQRRHGIGRRIFQTARGAHMERILFAALIATGASVAQATPVTITISATLPTGNTPTNFSTSFSVDSNAATTDVVTYGGGTYYGYARASLTGFGFSIDGASFTTADIGRRTVAVGHSSDFYLNAPIGSGAVTDINLYVLTLGTTSLQLGSETDDNGLQPFFAFRSPSHLFATTDLVTTSVLLTGSTVPEPEPYALLGVGLLGLTAARRRHAASRPKAAPV